MTWVTRVIRVPVDESLNINECVGDGSLCGHLVRVAYCVRAAVSDCFPVMIKLYMNSVHAARGVDARQAAATKSVVITSAENVESRI